MKLANERDGEFDGTEVLIAPEPALLAAAGGAQGVAALAEAFYARVARNPVLRPVFPRSTQRAGAGRDHLASRLARYLTELLGGPASFSDRYGHPRMYARHRPFRIGPVEAKAWVDEMAAALDDVAIGGAARVALLQLFDEAARDLINVDAVRAAVPDTGERPVRPRRVRAVGRGRAEVSDVARMEDLAHVEGAPQSPETHETASDGGPARRVATAGAMLYRSMATRWRVQRAGEALLDAIAEGDLARVQRLLPAADVHLAEALEAAATASRTEVVRLLLDVAVRGRVPESRRAVSVHRLHRDRLSAYAAAARLASRTVDGAPLLDRVAAVTLLRVQAAITGEPALLVARNWLGQTLLHLAAATGNERAVAVLLAAGADPHAADVQGHSPLATLANRAPRPDRGPLDDGCIAAAQLIAGGADPRARSGVEKQTPLHMAARRANVALAALLLEHGAPIDAQTTRGESPLRRAVNLDHVAFAGFLVRRGADPQLPDRTGTTPVAAARSPAMREALAGQPPRVERAEAGRRG